MKTLTLLSLVLVACGGSHVIGKDRCIFGSCAQGETCDFDGACRTMCGSNYPGVSCPSGTVCSGYICRSTCVAGSCPAGSACAATQSTNGVENVCGPVSCRDSSFCQGSDACVRGVCTSTGYGCGPDATCGADLFCDHGTCRARCGPNDSTQCGSGTSCQNALCL